MSNREIIITEDGSHTLFIPELEETYHSTHGAIQESNYVFIERGLNFFVKERGLSNLRIFEVGFGTGLNALVTALHAEKNRIFIKYSCIEPFPLKSKEVDKLNYSQCMKNETAAQIFTKIHETDWGKVAEISPYFQIEKTRKYLQDYNFTKQFDICFFDAFSPSKQPEMWERGMLEKIFDGLVSRGIFVTYCAKGQLKRDLKRIGFDVETLPGPPGKMQMVRGIKT